MLRGSPLSSVLRYAILGTGILAVVTCTSAQTIFRSSNGRFSAQVPSKWNIAEDQSSGQVKFSQGNVSASLGVERTDNGETPSAAEVLDGITQQLKDQCSSGKVVKHGAATLSGLTGAFNLLSCNDSKGPAIFKISVATVNDVMLIFNTAAPASLYSQVLPTLDAVEKSFRLSSGNASGGAGPSPSGGSNPDNAQKIMLLQKACASGVLTKDECAAKMAALTSDSATPPRSTSRQMESQSAGAAAEEFARQTPERGSVDWELKGQGGSNLYRDARGRFSVKVPPGWSARPQGENGSEGVEISRGSSWIYIGPYGNVRNTDDVVNGIISQYQPQYQDFHGDYRNAQVNGRDTTYGFFSGVNAKGEQVAIRLAGIAAPGGHFLGVMVSIPQSEAASLDPVIKEMFMSISFGGE